MADDKTRQERLEEHLAEEHRPGLEQEPWQRPGNTGQVQQLLTERANAAGMQMMTRVAYCDKLLRDMGVDVEQAVKSGTQKDGSFDVDAAVAAGLSGNPKAAKGPHSEWTGGPDSSDVERDVKAAQQQEMDKDYADDVKAARESGQVTERQVQDAEQAAQSRRAGSERGEVPRGDAPQGRSAKSGQQVTTNSGDSETAKTKEREAAKTTKEAQGTAGPEAKRVAVEQVDEADADQKANAKRTELAKDPARQDPAKDEDSTDVTKKGGGGK